MYCAACAEATEVEPCDQCGASPLLGGRYRLEHPLGRGASGITWAATALDTDSLVAIKAVTLPAGQSPKERELIAREVEVLGQISHPDVPALLDHMQVRHGGGVRIQYLVQTFVPGETLGDEASQRRFSEDDVLAVMQQVLPILSYLHQLSPPVVHRDLKPSNLIRRIDGGITLIDFGAVKDALSDPDLGGSTVAGTFGFMAPEQFRGDASPRSDLYALGATAVALLTRTEPRDLLDHAGRLQWHEHASPSAGLSALLDDLLAADPQERPGSAAVVLERVAALLASEPAPSPRPRVVPSVSDHDLSQDGEIDLFDLDHDTGIDAFLAQQRNTPGNGESKRTQLGFALAAAFGLFVVIRAILAPRDTDVIKSVEVIAPPAVSQCGDHPCLAPRAFRLRGLTLGMDRSEAAAVMPELAQGIEVRPESVIPDVLSLGIEDFMAMTMSSDKVVVPGLHISVRTLLADTPMTCLLQFADQDGLSRLSCEADDLPDARTHRQATRRIREALVGLHGPFHHDSETPLAGSGGSWHWYGDDATLDLQGEYTEFMGIRSQSLTFEVRSAAHDAVLEAAEAEAAANLEATRDAARRAARDNAAEEVERLKELTGGGDL